LKRPIYITIISWFFIAYAVLSLIPKLALIIIPEAYEMAAELSASQGNYWVVHVPFWVQIMHAYIGSIVLIISGIFMLKGRAWAKNLLVIWMLSVLVITFSVAGFSFHMYAKSIVTIIIILLLYRPAAGNYFK